MSAPSRILIVDDNPDNVAVLQARLADQGYELLAATDGEQALAIARREHPDLVLLDVVMPGMVGIQVCRELRADSSLPFMPIIMVTAEKVDSADVVAGLEAGGDEYLAKPIDQAALVARVRSMLRIKALYDTVQEQKAHIESQAAELSAWRLEQVERLRRFVAPQVAEIMLGSADEAILDSHRGQIAVVFCDLRGFSALVESAEPEEAMAVLREYHEAMGELIFRFQGTIGTGSSTGERLMVFFNDPLPCPDPAPRAARLALAMRERMGELAASWEKRGHRVGLATGVALGYATLGKVGFEGRLDYGAVGPVVQLAAGLCDQATEGQILVSQRAFAAIETLVEAEPVQELSLVGLSTKVPAFSLLQLKPNLDEPSSGSVPGLSLTRREHEVATLIARGFGNRQIAEELVITEGTAGVHVEHILGKLGFHSRAQVAAWAVANGLLTAQSD